MSALLVIIQPTYTGLVAITVLLGLIFTVLKGLISNYRILKLTCMNESGPVYLMH